MVFIQEYNQTFIATQGMLGDGVIDRRTAFRIWQLTPEGKTLGELAELLGMTGSGLSKSLSNDRMPVKHHRKLVECGVPVHLLPRPENVPTGPKPKSGRR